jgi:hypothetical protein
MNWDLAYVGSLAFVAFVMWLRRDETRRADLQDEKISALEGRIEGAARNRMHDVERDVQFFDRLKAVESTVSTLAVGAGLKMRSPVEPKA